MSTKKRKKLNLVNAATSIDAEHQLLLWFKSHGIQVKQTASMQYKILNGIIKNIMFYPSTMKLMFQEERNYIITSRDESTILGLINGDINFKQVGE